MNDIEEHARDVAQAKATPSERWGTTAESRGLVDSLMRLDAALEAAVVEFEASFDREPASAAFRGLVVTRSDAIRLLSLAPGRSAWTPADGHAQSRFVRIDQPSRLAVLQRRFGLDAFEIDVLLIAASPDLDQRYERLYGLLQDDVTRRRPTLATALHLAATQPVPQWEGLKLLGAPNSALMKHGLVRAATGPDRDLTTVGSCSLVADPQVVRFIAGHDALDGELRYFCDLLEPAQAVTIEATWTRHAACTARIMAALDGRHTLRFTGATAWERCHLAHAAASQRGIALMRVRLGCIEGQGNAEQVLQRALLAARLRDALVLVEDSSGASASSPYPGTSAWRQLLDTHDEARIVSSPIADDPGGAQHVDVCLPSAAERRACWQLRMDIAGRCAHSTDLDELAAEFQLGTDQVDAAADECIGVCATQAYPAIGRDALFAAARRQLMQRLPLSLQPMEPKARWQDLILAADTSTQLREICDYVRARTRVLEDWGFGRSSTRGHGVSMLFSGPSGTGKTTACDILANELGRGLMKIDLSQAVSKYIGESEKQLAEAFAVAERSGAVLVFDEADALFGKRTNVSDAHDRFANIEVSYLLQRIEAFQGLLVLTTNMPANIDAAFARRLQFVVEFPFPDEPLREGIWRASLPPEAPVDPDLDFPALAQRYPLAGGNIRNIALSAAMFAAGEGTAIAMRHMVRGARREYQKVGKTSPDAPGFAWGPAR